MLTRRGWSLVGAAVGLYAGGRLLALDQLIVLSLTAAVLLAGAWGWARVRRIDVAAARLPTGRLHVGSDGRVDLLLDATGARPTPTLSVSDAFDAGRRTARFLVPPLAPGARARAAYRVPTRRRGRFVLGPLRVSVTDPFGLARRSRAVLGTDEVIVLPRVHEILPPPRVGGDEPDLDAPPRHDRTQHHGEFLTLRPYQVGDDLRRVHWRSTARRDQLMIRQEESQPRTPVVVMLDVRPGAHDRPSFERAVEAVASLVAALERAGRPVTLVASTGARLGTPGRRHLASVLDELAVIEPHGADRVEVGRLGPRGLLVAVVGRLGTEDLDALGALTRGGSTLAVVDTRSTHAPVLPRRGRTPLVVGAGDEIPFPRAWNEAVLRWQQSRAPRSRPPSPSPA